MSTRNFREMFTNRQVKANTMLCVGLDPLKKNIPSFVREKCTTDEMAFFRWMRDVVDATAPYACMFKPQRAHWEAIENGERALRMIVGHIHKNHPGIPVFGDCKRGDIARTQTQYRVAHFELDGFDGMNYNGYMGKDTLGALVDKSHLVRALVGLGRTSNPEAWEFQDRLGTDGKKNWEFMIEQILKWSEEFGVLENAGVVMGAAHPKSGDTNVIYSEHLSHAREIVGDKLWFLIPGVGKQGGAVKETVEASYCGPGSIAVNSSSDVIFASDGPDFAEAAAKKAMTTQDTLNQYR